jgi:hypothetical protein
LPFIRPSMTHGAVRAVERRPRNKGSGFPVPVPDFADLPFAAWSPATQPRHFG